MDIQYQLLIIYIRFVISYSLLLMPQLITFYIGKYTAKQEGRGDEELQKDLPHNGDIYEEINLFSCDITHVGMESLRNLTWTNIIQLDLIDNRIGNKGCKTISKMALSKLQRLWLINNQIADEGISYLTKAKIPKLQVLAISSNPFRELGSKLVKGRFKELQELYLDKYDDEEMFLCNITISNWMKLIGLVDCPKLAKIYHSTSWKNSECNNLSTNQREMFVPMLEHKFTNIEEIEF